MAISWYLDYFQNGGSLIIGGKIHQNIEQIKIVVNFKLLKENWYNLPENYSLWRSIIWWQAKICSSSGSGLGNLMTSQPWNQQMPPFWNQSKYWKIATANLHQIIQISFKQFNWTKNATEFYAHHFKDLSPMLTLTHGHLHHVIDGINIMNYSYQTMKTYCNVIHFMKSVLFQGSLANQIHN